MEGSTATVLNGVVDILQGRDPPSALLGTGSLRLLFDAVYIVTLFFLIRAFARLGRWRGRLLALPPEKRRKKWIPVVMLDFVMPACMVLFIPKFFSADWAQGFVNAPDFSVMMLLISALLLALGAARAAALLRLGKAREQDGAGRPAEVNQ